MHVKGLFDYTQPTVAAATIVSVGFVVAASVGSYWLYKAKAVLNTIEVTGSAKRSVVSDFARWTISLETKTSVNDQQKGVDRLDQAASSIADYLARKGFTDFETLAPSVSADYIYPQHSPPSHVGHTVRRKIIVKSANIDSLSELAHNITPLAGDGYTVTTEGIEFTYQQLPEMRVALLAEAIRDARARAESIASETGRKIGKLRSATGGVVQVLAQGGVDISDYGSYDTQSKYKDVMVTVRASFLLE